MSLENPKESGEKFQDLITFKPQNIKVCNQEQLKVFQEYKELIKSFKDCNKMLFLTPKEIHEFYKDEEKSTSEKPVYKKSIKTVYRYLDKLKEAGFVVEAGKRMSDNSRMVENLYCLSAEIFFVEDPPIEERWWGQEGALDSFNLIINKCFGNDPEETKIDEDLMRKFFKLLDEQVDKIVHEANESEEIMNAYRNAGHYKINDLNKSAGIFLVLLKHPEILSEMGKMLKL